jgi:hypothetical protein
MIHIVDEERMVSPVGREVSPAAGTRIAWTREIGIFTHNSIVAPQHNSNGFSGSGVLALEPVLGAGFKV